MGAEQSQLIGEDVKQNKMTLNISGQDYTLNTEDMDPETKLVDFIRDVAGLKGTKYMCREGGCGACTVTVRSKDPTGGPDIIRSVNSCLTPLFSCDGWNICTIERLGNRKDGYHQIQQRMVQFAGSQCGFCTPGMIMNMYSLINANPGLKVKDIEDNFDGNICRCTGFRPILDAFKSLTRDAPEDLLRKCAEEENSIGKICPLSSECCKSLKNGEITENGEDGEELEEFETCCTTSKMHLQLQTGQQWVKAISLENVFEAIRQFQSAGLQYRLVAGNTSTGIFKNDGPFDAYLDVNDVPELRVSTADSNVVVLGGGLTISLMIEALKKASELRGFEYAAVMSKHFQRVANVHVRNAGTIAGNLMVKHAHNEFPSDIFLVMEAVGAKINIASAASLQRSYSLMEFLTMDMNQKVILSLNLSPLPLRSGYTLKTYKISRRYQNAHAYVNGAFLFKADSRRSFTIREKPTIVFGGISPTFVHATSTELYFVGKSLNDPRTLQGALNTLDREVQPDFRPPDATPEYRKALTQSLLYKTLLGLVGKTVQTKFRSGAKEIEHNLTSGKQSYDTDKSEWPLNEPVKKLEAVPQCSGEAEYVNDIQPQMGELFGAIVLTTVANATLRKIDATAALKMPGVVAFLSAKDIPGTNNYYNFGAEEEEIMVKSKVSAAGQPLGVIVATSRDLAFRAAKKVTAVYDGMKKPILTIKQAMKKADEEGKLAEIYLEKHALKIEKKNLEASKHNIKGEIEIGGQYHFQMEPQTTICIPREDGMDIYSATQWMDAIQACVAAMLGVQNNSLNIQVRRLGGGYGSKISRATQVAAICALASHITNKPVRIVLDIDTNMSMVGKRLPFWSKYEVGFNDAGKIESLKSEVVCDTGLAANEVTSFLATLCYQNCYEATGWELTPGKVYTNTPANTYCRAPGSTQGIAMVETIMEHIAHYLKKDPMEIRMLNLLKQGDPILAAPETKFEGENYIPKLLTEIKNTADYEDRKKFIETFNKNNRWMKRGMACVPMRYPQHYFSVSYPVYIAIFHSDGTVAISHGGIEMGQGINTKAAQVVAYHLKIPLDKVKVKPSSTFVNPNSMLTGGAFTSELVSYAATRACGILNERMAPIREKLKDEPWEKVVAACYAEGMDLTASYMPTPGDGLKIYDIWGLTLTEVEVDILTGEYKILRVDLIEDTGKSLSPQIDVGQCEGAHIMGIGMWTTEKLQYDKNTGQLLTANTWDYKPPFAKDIPEDFRISLMKNVGNPVGILGSKATGEAPLCMSVAVLFALKNAIDSARRDAGNQDFYQLDGPVTPEDIVRLSLTSKSQFTF